MGCQGGEKFYYTLRLNPIDEDNSTEFLLEIIPSLGTWSLNSNIDPNQPDSEIKKGSLDIIETDRWYELGVEVQDDFFRVFWDDMELLSQSGVRLYGLNNHFGLDPDKAGENAALDIDNWRMWDLGTADYMSNVWITESNPVLVEDNFTPDEGWQFSPAENEKYDNGRAVLYTEGR